jgi:hypothetical protein
MTSTASGTFRQNVSNNIITNMYSGLANDTTVITSTTSLFNLTSNVEIDSVYAYAFVVGGCDPDRPSYLNYIYNIMVATDILRSSGSKGDVVVFFQMKSTSEANTLPDNDIRLLNAMKIRIKYIPKAKGENFFRTMLDKFRVLGLIEYRRVLFMDSDVMPTGNLDYLFLNSDNDTPLLKENLVIAGREEPANGGFFMITPGRDELIEMNSIIQRRQRLSHNLSHPYFDAVVGWGHIIEPPDRWELRTGKHGSTWEFWAAFGTSSYLCCYNVFCIY